jgi:uncharacterized protein YbjT (DUF2867 family)
LLELLKSKYCSKVTVVVRRPYPEQHEKLQSIILEDFDKMNELKLEEHDAAFVCVGTTLKQAGTQEAQWKIDHDYAVNFSQIANQSGAKYLGLVSSMGSNANSSMFYARMKGQTEEDIRKIPFNYYSIFRPSLLITDSGDRKDSRMGESIAQAVVPWFDWALPTKYKSIHVSAVARAIRNEWEQVFLKKQENREKDKAYEDELVTLAGKE